MLKSMILYYPPNMRGLLLVGNSLKIESFLYVLTTWKRMKFIENKSSNVLTVIRTLLLNEEILVLII